MMAATGYYKTAWKQKKKKGRGEGGSGELGNLHTDHWLRGAVRLSSHRYRRLDLEAVIKTTPSVASTQLATICNTHTQSKQ